jgi:hypothetical protein
MKVKDGWNLLLGGARKSDIFGDLAVLGRTATHFQMVEAMRLELRVVEKVELDELEQMRF